MGFAVAMFLPSPGINMQRYPSRVGLKKREKPNRSVAPVARLFGPAIFEASKLKVVFLGTESGEGGEHPGRLPRAYTLTHSDITSKITLAVSDTVNGAQLQGWYNRLQRDEVVAEWRKVQGHMSLHVHCHISGGHFLLNLIARLRYYIFSKELPVVLKAFVHGDGDLFSNYPELEEATVWVYFQSNIAEFNRVECWGPLRDAASTGRGRAQQVSPESETPSTQCPWPPERCQTECNCCFPPYSLIPWLHDVQRQQQEKDQLLPGSAQQRS